MIVSTRTTAAGTDPTPDAAKAGQTDPLFAALLAVLSGLATPQQAPPKPTTTSQPEAADHPVAGAAPKTPAPQAISGLPALPTMQGVPVTGVAPPAPVTAPAGPAAAPTTPPAAPLAVGALPAPPAVSAPPVAGPTRPTPAPHVPAPEHLDLPVQAAHHEALPATADPIGVDVPATVAAPAPAATAPVPPSLPADAAPAVPLAVPVSAPAPAPAPPIVAATRHVPAAVVEAARKLHSDGAGRSSLVVRLDPPELGSVVVRLTVQHGRVDVVLRTPDAATSNQLQTQGRDVLDVLASHGLDLGSFDVAAHDSPDSPPQQSPQGSPERGSSRHRAAADGTATTVTDDVPEPRPAGTWL